MEPLLDVTPPQAVNFDLVVGKTLETVLSIHNPRSSTIVFKVKTTAPKRYCVRPNCCLVRAGEKVQVKITMQALKEIPPPDLMSKDKFLIQAGYASQAGADAEPKVVFDQLDKDALVDQKLLCTFNSSLEQWQADARTARAVAPHEVPRTSPSAQRHSAAPPAPGAGDEGRDAIERVHAERERAASIKEELEAVRSNSENLQRSIAEEKSQYRRRLRVIEDIQKKFEDLQTKNKQDAKEDATSDKEASAATAVQPAGGSALSSTLTLVLITLFTILLLKTFLPAASE